MQKVSLLLVGAIFSAGIAAGAVGTSVLHAQGQPTVKRTELQRTGLEGIEGREGVMYVADFAPGAAAPRHFHPGPEFIYILEGSLVVEPDGMPATTLKKGDTASQQAKHVHSAKNGSASEPAKVLVFLVSEKGQPLATEVK